MIDKRTNDVRSNQRRSLFHDEFNLTNEFDVTKDVWSNQRSMIYEKKFYLTIDIRTNKIVRSKKRTNEVKSNRILIWNWN